MNVTAKIIGLPSLLRKLKIIPQAARDEIRIAMGRQADEIVAMMKRLVPKESHTLERSIGWTWGAKIPQGAMALATRGKGDLTITIFAGSDEAYYARWQEFGTVKMAAQAFFFPSWRASKKSTKAAIRKAVRVAAQRVAAGG